MPYVVTKKTLGPGQFGLETIREDQGAINIGA